MPLANPVFNKRSLVQITYTDVINRLGKDGQVIQDIAEALDETNEMLQDITFKESNELEGYHTTIRTGLPQAYWKRINQGVPPSKSQVAHIREASGIMEAQSEVDPMLIELNGNTRAFRASEDKAFLEALNQTMQHQMIYGDATKSKEGFNGLECRYNTINKKKADSAKNVIDCGGAVDSSGSGQSRLASVYVVGWGDNVFGFYPKGTPVGLKVEDKGKIMVTDENGYRMETYLTIYRWAMGLCVRDWRYCARLCNINIDDLKAGIGIGDPDMRKANSYNLILALQEAIDLIPKGGNTHIGIYMNSDVFSGLNILSARCDQNVITLSEGLNRYGEHYTWRSFNGYPLRRVDQMTNNESKVV